MSPMGIEVSVAGIVPQDLRTSVLDRLSNHTHSAYQFEAREVVFDRGPPGSSEDSNVLRLRHVNQLRLGQENSKKPSSWTLVSLGRPERELISPDFLIRPIFTCPVLDGDPLEFTSALGYRRKFEFYRRGVAFFRGVVAVELFQIFEDEAGLVPAGWPQVTLITITATVPGARAAGTGSGQAATIVQQQESRNEGCSRVREMQAVLKGLVDLGRVEPF